MDLNRRVDRIESREDFIAFVRELRRGLEKDPVSWENRDLTDFLGALAAWTEDIEGYYQNVARQVPEQPT